MSAYWLLVAGFSGLAVALTSISSAYWIAALLIPTAGIVGDCLTELFAVKSAGYSRSHKWLGTALTFTLVGGYFNVALFTVPGIVGVLGWLFSHISRELEVLRAT